MYVSPTLLAMVALLAMPTSAQELAWELDTFDSSLPRVVSSRVLPTPGGGAVNLFVVTDPAGLPRELRVARYDANGDRMWTRAYGASNPESDFNYFQGPVFDAAVDPQGDLLLLTRDAGGGTLLLRLAPGGSTVWSESLGAAGSYRGTGVAVAPSGNVIVAGSFETQSLYPSLDVRAFDSGGSLQWHWSGDGVPQAGNSALGDALGVRVAPSGDVLVIGASDTEPFNLLYRPLAVSLSSAGAEKWRQTLGSHGDVTVAAPTQQGDWVLVSRVSDSSFSTQWSNLVRVDQNGTVASVTNLGAGVEVRDVDVDSAGAIYYGGTVPQGSGLREMVLGRASSAGSFLGTSMPSTLASTGVPSRAEGISIHGDQITLAGTEFGTGSSAIIASFRPDGTERWAVRREMSRSGVSGELAATDVATDLRGNLFVTGIGTRGLAATSNHLFKLTSGGPVGVSYCSPAVPNSTGTGASCQALGSDERTVDNVTLRVTELPPGAATLMLASRTQGLVTGAGGSQGTLCLGGAIGRYVGLGQVRRSDPSGLASLQLDLGDIPQPTGFVSGFPGETWNFQAWYRDANPGVTSNFSDAAAVTLQ